MIELKFTVSELDYDALLEQYLPVMAEKLRETGNPVGMLLSNGMPASMARSIVRGLPQETKDRLAADLFNGYAARLAAEAERSAAAKGLSLKVSGVRAEVV